MKDGPLVRIQETAEEVVSELMVRAPLDLWLVSHVQGARQQVLAAAGPWAVDLPPGTVLPWLSSLDLHMVAGTAPHVVPRVQDLAALVATVGDRWQRVEGYTGVPVLDGEHELFGTLSGLTRTPEDPALTASVSLVALMGRLLSTVVTAQLAEASAAAALTESRQLAHRDGLTGLLNRSGWQDALSVHHGTMRRGGGPLSVLVLDIDALKAVNDDHGHDAGDAVIRTTARVLVDTCRPGDVVARTGGDEFCILLVDADETARRSVAHRLAAALTTAGVDASVGGATAQGNDSLTVLTAIADAAMYDEKRARAVLRAELRRQADSPNG